MTWQKALDIRSLLLCCSQCSLNVFVIKIIFEICYQIVPSTVDCFWLLFCNFSHPMEVWSRCHNLILCWPHLNTRGWIFMLAKILYLMLMHQGLKLQYAPSDFEPSHKKIKWSWVGIKLLWGADLMLQGPTHNIPLWVRKV